MIRGRRGVSKANTTNVGSELVRAVVFSSAHGRLHRAEININRERRVATSGLRGLQKFDSIPERIIYKNAVVTLERLVGAQR